MFPGVRCSLLSSLMNARVCAYETTAGNHCAAAFGFGRKYRLPLGATHRHDLRAAESTAPKDPLQVTTRPLRVCIVGKYPPIEGGVSATTYWLARGLAARGHEIYIVTNADEVEGRYRMQLDSADAEMLQPQFDN